MPFDPVPTRVDFVELEHRVQEFWDRERIPEKYLKRNEGAAKRWSFIDGPLTANNPMGVHHAWGRSYKDLYQRLKTMQGFRQRYQNGYDCQGLWVEVEVEKELGFKSKKDIETFGIDRFVEACKERVIRFSRIMTEQSIRLGYWMDWDNNYYTNSPENNYTIWLFLEKCWRNGWIYKGKDVMPWCPRCGTGISQHEIVTEGYQELTHKSVYLKFPLSPSPVKAAADAPPLDGGGAGGGGVSLLVWTTTPWTLAANVAAAVHPELTYLLVRQGEELLYISKGAVATAVRGDHEVLQEVKGSDLVGLTYRSPFDELPAQQGVVHRVIAWDEVSDAEGTGIVHIAPGAGAEDFALSKEHGLDVIAPLDENGAYLLNSGFGFLEGKLAGDVPSLVFDSLRKKGLLYRVQDYTHRYPTCWRCGSELVFRLVDEWFISMDGPKDGKQEAGSRKQDPGTGGAGGSPPADKPTSRPADKPLREQIMDITPEARWIPDFGLARELDWLKNMHDWMISKKRYYGLALPIYECDQCGRFEVIGSETQLKERAVEGWELFEGHTPHRPWIDHVKIECQGCGARVSRIKDVGNPWLDAGIVPYSTLDYRHNWAYWEEWFPADWVSESFPGQFRNWFYSLLAMSAVMEGRAPFKALFGYALLRDEKGEEMHKSKGNAIWFDDAAERMGADVMRWVFLRHPPANNINFGWHSGDEVKRGFLSTLWNTYSFFVTYANIDGWSPDRNQESGITNQAESSHARPEPVARAELVEGPPAEGGARGSAARPEALEGRPAHQPPTTITTISDRPELDRWALSELNQLIKDVSADLGEYDSMNACRRIEDFVESLSNWYVRRSRRRFWRSESDADKRSAYETLWTCLETLSRLLAPFLPFLAEDMWQNLVRSPRPLMVEDSPRRGEGPGVGAASVHLTDWPVADDALIDRDLQEAVRLVQRLASLGRSARAKANIKVRQPLAKVHVKVRTLKERETVRGLSSQLIEELNVKQVVLIDDEAEYFEYQVRPNLPVLGPKLGPRVGDLQRSLAAADKAAVARAAASGRPIELDAFTLEPSEVLVTTQGKPGFAAAEDAGYAAVITTEITAGLADEGLAREVVRRIQEMRRTAGFDIADRIRLTYEGDADIARVMRSWRDYIAQETLAAAVEPSPPPPGAHVEQHDIDGRKVTLSVSRPSTAKKETDAQAQIL